MARFRETYGEVVDFEGLAKDLETQLSKEVRRSAAAQSKASAFANKTCGLPVLGFIVMCMSAPMLKDPDSTQYNLGLFLFGVSLLLMSALVIMPLFFRPKRASQLVAPAEELSVAKSLLSAVPADWRCTLEVCVWSFMSPSGHDQYWEETEKNMLGFQKAHHRYARLKKPVVILETRTEENAIVTATVLRSVRMTKSVERRTGDHDTHGTDYHLKEAFQIQVRHSGDPERLQTLRARIPSTYDVESITGGFRVEFESDNETHFKDTIIPSSKAASTLLTKILRE